MFSFRARRQRVDNVEPVLSTFILSPVAFSVFPAATFQDAFPQIFCVIAVPGNCIGQILSWKPGKESALKTQDNIMDVGGYKRS
jgi:hypothetical protein